MLKGLRLPNWMMPFWIAAIASIGSLWFGVLDEVVGAYRQNMFIGFIAGTMLFLVPTVLLYIIEKISKVI